MFIQGKQPCLIIPKRLHKAFQHALTGLGYESHDGPRWKRDGETQTWVVALGNGRQIHVQEEELSNGNVAVFAHTEPAGFGPRHLASALRDEASFSGGSKALKADLRKRGWQF